MKEWLGLGSEVAYRSTAGIRQDEVAVIGAGRKELSQSLQATVTGSEGGRGALEAVNSLNRELTELLRGTRGPAKNPGPLARADEEIAAWQAKRADIAQVVEERKEARRRLEQIETERGEIEERLEALEGLTRDSLEREDIEEDIEDFHRRYRQLESAAALIDEDDETSVYVVNDGAVIRRAVQTGIANGSKIEILGGLSEDDVVVVVGHSSLRDGSRVLASNSTPESFTG